MSGFLIYWWSLMASNIQMFKKVLGWLVKLILKFLKTIYFLHIYQAIDPVPKVNEEYFPLLCTHDFH